MIDVESAHRLIIDNAIKLNSEQVSLNQLIGRVLAEPLKATREQPPFDRVAMDGIAIKFSDKEEYPLEGTQKAGTQALKLKSSEHAIEVMTGATLPIGTDTVVPYEKIKIENGIAILEDPNSVVEKQNIHFRASDYSEGKVLLEKGTKINSSSVAIIASQGLSSVSCFRQPRIAVVSTGDELIEPGMPCEPWQIWRSNAYSIQSELIAFGIEHGNIDLHHLRDDKEIIFNNLKTFLKDYDLIILSGGVSMGKFDYVHGVMGDLGVNTQFHKISQKPGKPLYFGTGESGTNVFGLPGNPVSAIFCLRRYVLPSLESSFELKTRKVSVILREDVSFKKEFTLFKAAQLLYENGKVYGVPLNSNGSGDFSSLGMSHGFMELPAEQKVYKAGEVFEFYPWSGGLL